jgi:hypothetical protein
MTTRHDQRRAASNLIGSVAIHGLNKLGNEYLVIAVEHRYRRNVLNGMDPVIRHIRRFQSRMAREKAEMD